MTKCTTVAVICIIFSLATNFSHGELSSEKDVKSLKKDLRSKDFDRKKNALYELKSLGIDGAEAMDALVATLDDPKQRIRSIAASTLEAMGKESWPATPKLIKLLSEGTIPRISSDMGGGYPNIGFSAARTLAKIDSESVAPLTTCLTHKKPEARYFAAYALGEIGVKARSAIPRLLPLLKDHDAMVRGEATLAIGKIGSDTPKDLVPVLEKMLDDKQLNVRFAAVESLGKLCPVSPEAVYGLIKGMRDEKAEIQVYAVRTLGNLGDFAKPAVSEMVKFLGSQKSYKHSHYPLEYPIANVAARSLGKIGPAAKSALPALLDVICQKNHKYKSGDITISNRQLRGAAMVAAAHICPDDSQLCNTLDKLLDEPDCTVDVVKAFGILGAKAKPYISHIEKKFQKWCKKKFQKWSKKKCWIFL